jgi:uncharacterized protein (DUF2147 family)
MVRKLLLSAALLACTSFAAHADIIEGDWKRPTGNIVTFKKCGAAFCAIAKTGKFAGQSAGSMAGKDGKYRGSLTDLEAKKTYKGKASITGNKASMSGCVFGGLVCKTEIWLKQ